MALKTFLRTGLRIPNLPNDVPAIVAPVPALLLRSCAYAIMHWTVIDDHFFHEKCHLSCLVLLNIVGHDIQPTFLGHDSPNA